LEKREAIVIYNNLPSILAGASVPNQIGEPTADYGKAMLVLALKIDLAMREKAPAGWRSDDTRKKQVLNAPFPLLNKDRHATMALFELIKNMSGY
jgi:type I restriction enzyme R subunit